MISLLLGFCAFDPFFSPACARRDLWVMLMIILARLLVFICFRLCDDKPTIVGDSEQKKERTLKAPGQ